MNQEAHLRDGRLFETIQSRRYRLIRFWYGIPDSSASSLKLLNDVDSKSNRNLCSNPLVVCPQRSNLPINRCLQPRSFLAERSSWPAEEPHPFADSRFSLYLDKSLDSTPLGESPGFGREIIIGPLPAGISHGPGAGYGRARRTGDGGRAC